jgi:hypothetical protein
MRHSSVLNLDRLKELCGENEGLKLAMATTHWSAVKPEDGVRREKELVESFWKDILTGGKTKMIPLKAGPQDASLAIDFILGITAPSKGEAPKRGNDKWRAKILKQDDTSFEDAHVDDLIIA